MAQISKNMVKKGRRKFKKATGEKKMKDEIIVRKTYELTNDSLTLFNEIFLENDFKTNGERKDTHRGRKTRRERESEKEGKKKGSPFTVEEISDRIE